MSNVAAACDQCMKQNRTAARAGAAVITLAIVIDGIATTLLREVPAILEPASGEISWNAAALMRGLQDFRADTVDCCLLYLIRVAVLMALTRTAIACGRPSLDDLVEEASSTQPLVINASSGARSALAAPATSTEINPEHFESYRRSQLAERRKNVVIGALFASSTAAQIYIGVKSIAFEGVWAVDERAKMLQASLFGLSVVLINLESWLATRLIHAMTADEGHFCPE